MGAETKKLRARMRGLGDGLGPGAKANYGMTCSALSRSELPGKERGRLGPV